MTLGKNIAVAGFVNDETVKCELILDDSGKPIGYNFSEIFYKNTNTYWYWKEDEAIRKAHNAFDEGNYAEALDLYNSAIELNPKHSYLQNIVAYLNYIKENDPDIVQAQNEAFSGDYGPRKFWIEDGKFFYKRKDDNTELAKVELLPISENRYMDLTRLGTIMTFEEDPSGKMASKSYSFIIGDDLEFVWRHVDDETVTNYFLKDD